jgi:tyrosine-specific transport protein
LGANAVGRINLFLMGGLGITYVILILLASQSLDFNLLTHVDWGHAWCAIPILFTAFAFQFIIPTLVSYMERDFKKIKFAIILGSSIPFLIYLIWEFTILGIVPIYGSKGLVVAGQLGDTAIEPLMYVLASPALFEIGKYFAFFTMTVSFIALSTAFLDFLADGFHVKKKGYKHFILVLVAFGCPMIIALTHPDSFSVALKYTGGVIIAILLCLFPPLMVWVGRYVKKYPKMPQALFGGRPLLAILFILTLVEIYLDLFIRCT